MAGEKKSYEAFLGFRGGLPEGTDAVALRDAVLADLGTRYAGIEATYGPELGPGGGQYATVEPGREFLVFGFLADAGQDFLRSGLMEAAWAAGLEDCDAAGIGAGR